MIYTKTHMQYFIHFRNFLFPFLFLFFSGKISAQDSLDFSQRGSANAMMKPFYHGVASGDPLPDKVMLWTRVTPDTGIVDEIVVYWQVALDTAFTQLVNFGKTVTNENYDFTVKVDVCGLEPATHYYYMFHALEQNSIIGRTRTAPASDVDSARFAVVSCSSYEHGYFNAYRQIADRNDVDAVIHLGDYIYEYGVGGYSANISGRTYDPPHEIITLSDYRTRHSHYKLDEDLRKIHQYYPFITTWDDHESANNSWVGGAENHTPASEGPWEVRKDNSVQAYSEWMPIRQPDEYDSLKIWRTIKYGNLLDMIVLDTRLYGRHEQGLANASSPNKKLLGDVQFDWFEDQLSDTSALWKIVCQQVMMAPLRLFGIPLNSDQWDGYQADRSRFINHVTQNNIENVVVLTGDIHTSWANDIPGSNYNPFNGNNSVCVEFVTTSITSPGFPFSVPSLTIQSSNPHMKYIQLTKKGYVILDVNENRAQADWNYVSTITSKNFNPESGESWFVNKGERHVRKAGSATTSPMLQAPVPPEFPNHAIATQNILSVIAATTPQNEQVEFCFLNPTQSVCPGLSTEIVEAPLYGNVTINQGAFCHSYTPAAGYAGTDSFTLEVCSTGEPFLCDTITVYVTVEGEFNTAQIFLTVPYDSSITHCFSFDDLFGAIDTAYVEYFSAYGTIAFNQDTCLYYESLPGFSGTDTLIYVACDDLIPALCDTVEIYFEVLPPDTSVNVSIPVLEVYEPMVLLGQYPNPFSEFLILQYFLYEQGDVKLEVRDLSGRLIHTSLFAHEQTGLKYAKVYTAELASGTYILSLSLGKKVFRRKMVKVSDY